MCLFYVPNFGRKGMLPLACLSLWVCLGGCLLVEVYASWVVCRDLGLLVETLNGEC